MLQGQYKVLSLTVSMCLVIENQTHKVWFATEFLRNFCAYLLQSLEEPKNYLYPINSYLVNTSGSTLGMISTYLHCDCPAHVSQFKITTVNILLPCKQKGSLVVILILRSQREAFTQTCNRHSKITSSPFLSGDLEMHIAHAQLVIYTSQDCAI